MKKSKSQSQIIIYKAENGETKIDVRFDHETVWLTQDQMADLFGKGRSTITEHVQNIFIEKELNEKSVYRDFRRTGSDGKEYVVKYYNLDVIISVGYRVKSLLGTQFRIWATQRLREFIIKGFVMDDERLKNPDLPFDYFEELSRRITDIRTSEKRFYRKITDIYATSVDYDPTDKKSIVFFKTVQNKVHYAVSGNTAAEIIANRVDSKKPNVGLTSFRGSKPTKQELLVLNNLVEQYLIFAQGQAIQRIPMYMQDWIDKLNGFLQINNKRILEDAGKISHELAVEIAEKNFDEYKKIEAKKIDDDFDSAVLHALKIAKKRGEKF